MTYTPRSPFDSPTARLIDRVFEGTVGPQDARFMAMAILQISDEMHELRQHIVALEQVVRAAKLLPEKAESAINEAGRNAASTASGPETDSNLSKRCRHAL